MRVLLLSLAVPLALADLPTPKPTITPAPTSDCNYEDEANGPFALDCLQAEFLTQGCSVRGLSYPTETNVNEDGDKAEYNAMTWSAVKQAMGALTGAACRGPPTEAPTQEPTATPVTSGPSPTPTRAPTAKTPAPTYSEEFGFKVLARVDKDTYSDDTEAAEKLQELCEEAGYARQYDATQYLIALTMGAFTDYFTFVPDQASGDGRYTSICDMLGDPENNTPLWSDSPNGPFMKVNILESKPLDRDNAGKTPDNREYPSWLDHANNSGGGYGAAAQNDKTAAGERSYVLAITSLRSFSQCVERVDPSVQEDDYEACERNGADGQLFKKSNAVECGGGDSTNLQYALFNRVFATCDDLCVWHPDFSEGDAQSEQSGQYWYWTSGANCWKPRSAYTNGEFQNCDPTHNSFQYEDEWAFAQLRQDTLCSERCDFVNGWVFSAGSCYKVVQEPDYRDEEDDNNFEKAQSYCESLGGNLASITSETENNAVGALCDSAPCYIGNDFSKKGKADGKWLDGEEIIWSNWNGGYERVTADDGDYLTITEDNSWAYDENDKNLAGICEMDPEMDEESSNQDFATVCMNWEDGNSDALQTNVRPELVIEDSGFTDADQPGVLNLVVTIPKYMYNPYITFENATNDAAEYNWQWGDDTLWDVDEDSMSDPEDDPENCNTPMKLVGKIDWTVFNLGGAGGVQRLVDYINADGEEIDPDTDLDSDDFSNSQYLFGSVIRIEVTQPIYVETDDFYNKDNNDDMTSDEQAHEDKVFRQRQATFQRNVVARIPFVLQFQKTVSVSTDVDIISTKFNYKTVAAIIQSIQFDTSYFQHPYAKIRMQIRTKSQYPYLFNKDVDSIDLHPIVADTDNDNVALSIEHLHDDANCTFTNPDHTREGDVCTQEWMLTLVPDANVCYATGEYTVEYEADCFYGKEVCYMPKDDSGEDINTVKFTFKVQTSKFCPTIADEVDLSGTLTVTGRESFKPDEENVEDATEGQLYLQGETIHLFATTESQKAVITSTKVVMVELEQDLDDLIMTGYNRIPFDDKLRDITVWTEEGEGRIADGTITIDAGDGDVDVFLMDDDMVFASGTTFNEGEDGEYSFEDTEAGFQIELNAKAFPVNVDSIGTKTLIATLEVTYEALDGNRRRLLAVERGNDLRSFTKFQLNAFQPNFEQAKSDSLGLVTLSMELTLNNAITRNNVRGFIQSFENAILNSLGNDPTKNLKVVERQLAIDAVWSNGHKIWSRPSYAGDLNFAKRRLQLGGPKQRLQIEFTVVKGPHGAASVMEMLTIFDKQLRSPSSPLMRQPIFYGAVVHKCIVVKSETFADSHDGVSAFNAYDVAYDNESSATRSLPTIFVALLLALLW